MSAFSPFLLEREIGHIADYVDKLTIALYRTPFCS
jgi:hypothetical protein